MATLADTLQQAMEGYAGEGMNGHSYLTRSLDGRLFTVVFIGQARGETVIDTGLIARVSENRIVIEHDVNSKPLVDALMQTGIPREQIVLAYTGEHTEETV